MCYFGSVLNTLMNSFVSEFLILLLLTFISLHRLSRYLAFFNKISVFFTYFVLFLNIWSLFQISDVSFQTYAVLSRYLVFL